MMTKRLSGWGAMVFIDREDAVRRVRCALYGDDCIPELTSPEQDLADLPWDEARDAIGLEKWAKLRARRNQVQRQFERAAAALTDWALGGSYGGRMDRQSFDEAFEAHFPGLMRSVSINPAAAKDGQRPSYSEPVIYSVDKVPNQFSDWARELNNLGITITVKAAEDAMRGPNVNGRRSGGLLVAGKGLSREAIRAWVGSLPPAWKAAKGVPPSRARSS